MTAFEWGLSLGLFIFFAVMQISIHTGGMLCKYGYTEYWYVAVCNGAPK